MNARRLASLAPLALCLAAACETASTTTTSGGAEAGTGTDGGSPSDGAAPAGDASKGSDCVTEPGTSTPLCARIDTCPGLSVADSTPLCGFVAGSATITLACACDGRICPMAQTSSCAAAKSVIDANSPSAVCVACGAGGSAGAGGAAGAGGSAGAGGGCDKTCAEMCAGDPGCLVLCGC